MTDKKYALWMISTVLMVGLLVGFVFSFQPAQGVSASSGAAKPLSAEVGDSTNATGPVCTMDMTNAIAYWDLDETSGTIFEDTIGVNDGTCVGDTCPSSVAGITAGGQFFFDSDGDFIAIESPTGFDWTSESDFSVGAWVKTTQDCTGRKVFIGRYHPTNGSGWIGCEPEPGNTGVGFAAFHMRDSNGISSTAVGNTRINDGRWHYIVGVRDGTADENLIYIDDGAAEDTVTSPGYTGTFSKDTDVTIGAYYLQKGFFSQGTLDEIAIFSNALTSAEINTYWSSCTFKPIVGDVPFVTDQDIALDITELDLLGNSVPNGGTLSIASVAPSSAKGGTITGSGPYQYTPQTGYFGTDFFTFVVSDVDSDTAEGNAVISVVSLEFPEVVQPDVQNNDEGETITPMQIVATDPNGDDLTFAATDLPTGLIIDPLTGIISGTVASTAAEGSATYDYAVTVSVTDDSPEANETSVNFNWRINRVNVSPELENPGPQSNHEGDDVDLPIVASDDNEDPLTYGESGLPPGLSIDTSTGLISGMIADGASAASPYFVTISVSDGEAAPVEVTFNWTVLVKSEVEKIYLPILTK